jgi:ribosome-associated protein
MTSRNLALRIVSLVHGKSGADLLLLDLRRTSPISDFFTVCTARSPLHAQAIADEVLLKLKQQGIRADHVEGYETGQWILLDFVDVVVHIFLADIRQFYGLERLWGDMPQRRFRDQDVARDVRAGASLADRRTRE